MANIAQAAEISVFHHALVGAAEEMGEVLKRSAFSPNIKERQDYSCALFDANGRLLAQAAHLPVHLGSMPASVEAVVHALGQRLRAGTCAVVNDPFRGGTHLPDITLVAPVFAGGRLLGYAANRAHHADIGGGAPGSMSPQTDLIAEGLVIPPMLLDDAALSLILANTRTPEERQGDLAAQRAACARGVSRLQELQRREGKAFERRCKGLLAHSRALMLHSLGKLKPGVYSAEDVMDDDGAGAADIRIRLRLQVGRKGVRFDFAGSRPQVRGGINAVLAVTQSACYYAALCFCDPVPPVNAGCFECVSVIAPKGSIVNARRPAAVAGGNVETSQRIVDVCLSALSKAAGGRGCAQSQGTMNNVTIGGGGEKSFTYYETVAGGCGATRERAGASATHSHMTNTLNTPIEALEHAYPLRVEEYSLRAGAQHGDRRERAEADTLPSHGRSLQPACVLGGAGVVRRIRALVPCEFGLLTERRRHSPRGLNGAPDGEVGQNTLIRGGNKQSLPPKCSGRLEAGDALEIRTPGGGSA